MLMTASALTPAADIAAAGIALEITPTASGAIVPAGIPTGSGPRRVVAWARQPRRAVPRWPSTDRRAFDDGTRKRSYG